MAASLQAVHGRHPRHPVSDDNDSRRSSISARPGRVRRGRGAAVTLVRLLPSPVRDVLRRGYRPIDLACEGALWRPGNARLALASSIGRAANERAGYTDSDHVDAAIAWLERAHDAGGDGGVAGRYLLGKGWTSSYPETTGY